ncbi:MAG TPA: ABC transporter permease [Chloroflexi bacterium]|nr:ABC transporter permease [Chloroflexota bacterium]HBY08541.1 ABC transporter permease [Chloroflexota bacterium]
MSTGSVDPAVSKRSKGFLIKIWHAINIPLAAVVLALLIGAIILLVSGANPIQAYVALFRGAFGSMTALGRTLEKATPLVFSGLAVAFAFKAGLFNIGAQGQLLFGAMIAAAIGFGIDGLPSIIHVPLALLGGALAGALYGAIPGALKVYTGAHEVITTIMLNYIAINITDYLASGPLKDTSSGNVLARTPEIMASAKIPSIANIPLGFVLAILMSILIWWILSRTTLGFDIRTVGLNPNAARYAGIKVAFTIILTMVLSGALAGMGGAVETQGVVGRFQPGFNIGLGFDGITIALLGKTSPLGVIPAAILIGAMKAGASQMQFDAGVAKEIVDVIQALMLFFVAADVIVRKVFRIRAAGEEEKITLSTGWGQQ